MRNVLTDLERALTAHGSAHERVDAAGGVVVAGLSAAALVEKGLHLLDPPRVVIGEPRLDRRQHPLHNVRLRLPM